jgi:hypothetical protein
MPNPNIELRRQFRDRGAEGTKSTSHSASQFQRFLPLDLFPAGYATVWQTVQRAILPLQWKSNFYRTCRVSIKSRCSASSWGERARKRKIRSLSRKQNRVRSATLVLCYAPAWRCTPKRRLRARCEMESALKIHAEDVKSLVIEFYELHSSPFNGKWMFWFSCGG